MRNTGQTLIICISLILNCYQSTKADITLYNTRHDTEPGYAVNRDYTLEGCDWNKPCPEGLRCEERKDVAPHRFLCYPVVERLGKRGMIPGDSKIGPYDVDGVDFKSKMRILNDMQCPPKDVVSTCKPCQEVEDCGRGLVCCPAIDGKRSCTAPRGAVDATTKLKTLIEGKYQILSREPLVTEKSGSVTLFQTQGLNILIDAGASTSQEEIVEKLNHLGLKPEDIYLVVVTHAHTDHFGSSHLFKCPQIYGKYRINGDIFVANDLSEDGRNYLCTRNAYVVWTPGHSYEDITLVVERVPHLGRVAMVGDLFISENDIKQPAIWDEVAANRVRQKMNRRKIICAVDAIVPGHGAMFNVTSQMRVQFNCAGL